jgi:hypothetical protein
MICLLASFMALAGLLSSCRPSFAGVIGLWVNNNSEFFNYESSHKTCQGGLKGRFEVGSLFLESPLVAAGELYEEEKERPVDAPEWAQTEAEAWCYDEAGEEIGYIRVSRRWHAAHVNGVFFFGPPVVGAEPVIRCFDAVEERGEAPCVFSGMLE